MSAPDVVCDLTISAGLYPVPKIPSYMSPMEFERQAGFCKAIN